MNELDRQLATAVKNLSALDQKAVPRASAMAINRIANRAISRSVKETSKAVRVQQKIIRRYARVSKKASPKQPVAYVRVRRNDIPAIHIGEARTQIRRKKGRYQVQNVTRGKDGRYAKREISGFTSIKVGKHRFDNAFLQKLKNGKWHIMQRTSEARYPIKMCAIPIRNEITTAFETNSNQLMKTDMPKELSYAMGQQIRLVIRRDVSRGN
ncbi:TPA: phage tail protein [Vibrio vulnificus]|uniref:phage tail protein n=1 Tax=Vibrio vulnificus TaxID=672 RepID=UPI000CD0CAAC|nr:phage tail protein [Vibrio vulnificus]EGR0063061.1 phage tail protein [Vibrio vulnificus]MCU8492714.1 phage tail protein [Vibrio vulnificus]POC20128.1 phage tail protein [Vibrio vulnificus]HAS8479872.1 phage tail protein [Vibrio vulnificus]